MVATFASWCHSFLDTLKLFQESVREIFKGMGLTTVKVRRPGWVLLVHVFSKRLFVVCLIFGFSSFGSQFVCESSSGVL